MDRVPHMFDTHKQRQSKHHTYGLVLLRRSYWRYKIKPMRIMFI